MSVDLHFIGWGKISFPGTYNNNLQHASLAIISKSDCISRNSKYATVTFEMICASNDAPAKQSGCQGDSGGPFVCQQSNGSWKQFGVVSWGSVWCDIRDASTVFSKVTAHRSWIIEQMTAS